jgi:hypothetical protein
LIVEVALEHLSSAAQAGRAAATSSSSSAAAASSTAATRQSPTNIPTNNNNNNNNNNNGVVNNNNNNNNNNNVVHNNRNAAPRIDVARLDAALAANETAIKETYSRRKSTLLDTARQSFGFFHYYYSYLYRLSHEIVIHRPIEYAIARVCEEIGI